MRTRDIVVGVDGSPSAAAALRWALQEAQLRDWDVTAVMVWNYLERAQDNPDGRFDEAYNEDAVRTELEKALEEAVGADAATHVERLVLLGNPTRGILDTAEGSKLLVVGTRGQGGFRALVLGSVSEQCLQHSSVPVAVVHSPEGSTDETPNDPAAGPESDRPRIVVGIDGSAHAQKALRWAIDEARVRRATLQLVHAWRAPFVPLGVNPYLVESPELEAEARQVLDDAVAQEDLTGLPADAVQYAVPSGPAGWVLLEASEGAELTVMGSRGLGGFKGLLLGATSQQVARHATGPVLVVPNVAEA